MTDYQIPFPLSVYDGKIDTQGDEIWVRSKDFPTNVARKIVDTLGENQTAHVATMGADSINQAIKGIAIARQTWRDLHDTYDLYAVPHFSTIIDGHEQQRTRMVIIIFPMRDDLAIASLFGHGI